MTPREGDAFFSSAMTAGPAAEARRRAAANPRGTCAAAHLASSARLASGRLEATRRRASATIWSRVVGMVKPRLYEREPRWAGFIRSGDLVIRVIGFNSTTAHSNFVSSMKVKSPDHQ